MHLLEWKGQLPQFPYNVLGLSVEQLPDPVEMINISFAGQMAKMRRLQDVQNIDLIDAKALTQYGQGRQKDLKLYQKLIETDEELRQLLTYLEGLKKQRAAHKNRLQSPGYWDIKDIIEETIRRLDEIIAQFENKIKELIKKSKKVSKKNRRHVNL